MKAVYSDQFLLPLPSGHRFPMAKYQMLRDRLQADFPEAQLAQALRASDEELALVHNPDYVQSIATDNIDPKAMSERARRSVGATVAACRSALSEGIAANLAGGTHHSCADRGSGFRRTGVIHEWQLTGCSVCLRSEAIRSIREYALSGH